LARGGGYRLVPSAAGYRATDDLIWIGNWGDGERGAELNEFLVNRSQT